MCFFDQYTLNKCLFPSRAEWSAHDNNEHTQVLQIPFIYQEIYKWLQCKRQDASSSLRSYLSWIFFQRKYRWVVFFEQVIFRQTCNKRTRITFLSGNKTSLATPVRRLQKLHNAVWTRRQSKYAYTSAQNDFSLSVFAWLNINIHKHNNMGTKFCSFTDSMR